MNPVNICYEVLPYSLNISNVSLCMKSCKLSMKTFYIFFYAIIILHTDETFKYSTYFSPGYIKFLFTTNALSNITQTTFAMSYKNASLLSPYFFSVISSNVIFERMSNVYFSLKPSTSSIMNELSSFYCFGFSILGAM